MPASKTQSVPISEIPLGVITAREPVSGNAWISERWKVLGVVAGQVNNTGGIVCRQLRAGPEGEEFLWTGFVLRLQQNEVDSYYYNIVGQNPSVYVYCQNDDSGEPRPRAVTIDYIDAMSHGESGNATFSVPMPPEVYRCVEEFVLAHYTPEEPKMKRKHEREPKVSGIWEDE
jgi:hypothetical protein